VNDAAGANRTFDEYLADLASGAPTPGGGSAAAYAGAFGAALIAMVMRLTKSGNDPKLAARLAAVSSEADRISRDLADCAARDEEAYALYRAATSLPKETDAERAERSAAVQSALHQAALAPIAAARTALDALVQASAASKIGTKHALSDIRTARHLLNASISGAFENVMVNLALIRDERVRSELIGDVQAIQAELGDANAAIDVALEGRERHGRSN
jgi:formiminotetrahydrofolate cyclodeaminase